MTTGASAEGLRPAPDDAGDAGGGSEVLDLLPVAEALRGAVRDVALPLELPSAPPARRERVALLDQLDDYLLPRLRTLDAPLLAVVGGSTGAGKSTLVNSIVGRQVSTAGVLRPTTRSPVLVHHPDDRRWFADQRVMPSLARVTGEEADPAPDAAGRISAVRLVPEPALPRGLAVLDAPDIDSVVEANRELATQLLAAADLWLFVTTAARYADAVPWDLLRAGAERGTAVAVVLDRVPDGAMAEVRPHLAAMLTERGLGSAPLFALPETTTSGGLLPDEDVAPLRRWLLALAEDAQARDGVVRRTLLGAVRSLPGRVRSLAAAADEQGAAVHALRSAVRGAYGQAREDVEGGLSDGTLLRGEVLARWQELVGTGDLFRQVESTVGRLRDRVVAAVRGRPAPVEPLGEALQTGVEALVQARLDAAAAEAALRWRAVPGGPPLVAEHPELARSSPDLAQRLPRTVRDWQGGVLELVRAEGADKRATARVLSYGVNGAAVVLMLVVFAGTAGLSGAEVGIAAGSAVLAQKLLEAVFGDQAVRELAAKARADLLRRVDALVEDERARFDAVVEEAGFDPGAVDRLRTTGTSLAAMPVLG